MITKDQVIPLLIGACPSYKQRWEQFSDKDLLYVALGDFADYLLTLKLSNQTTEFTVIGKVIEDLHTSGDHYVAEAATIGLLEGIQNVWANRGGDPEDFRQYLGPTSALWWEQLNLFWQKKIRFVGETMPNKRQDHAKDR